MNTLMSRMSRAGVRPFLLLAATVALLAAVDGGQGRVLSNATLFSTLQSFATLGPVALGLGLTMLIGEFDLSVAGMFGLAGCIAVLTGELHPWLGLLLALGAGLTLGLTQSVVMTWLQLSSIGVTLGGLLTTIGLAYVLTESQSLVYGKMDVALALNERFAGALSIRSAVAVAIVLAAAAVLGSTRIGRDLVAIGSDRRAATIAGVNTDRLVIGTFAFSGMTAALSGSLLSYSLASASPSGLSDVLVPAAAAAILGGVSLSGGSGTPLGIAAGVLTLAVLRAGLNAVGAEPYTQDLVMGSVLLTVAVLDGPHLARRLDGLRALLRVPAS